MQIHYAYQTCDVKSYQGLKRFCGDDRTELSKKSLKSFLLSVKYCAENNTDIKHNILIIGDQCSENLKDFILTCKEQFTEENISIDFFEMKEKTGIKNSIEECYLWLQKNGKDLVYQVQDDYLFTETAIYEMIDLFLQIKSETGSECLISPYNDSWYWLALYRNRSTPRTVIVSKHRYWIQYYDMSCCFMTSHNVFREHWDLYHAFFTLIDDKTNSDLENLSLNYMLTQRGILGLVPINSLAFHMQSEVDKDPHIDWKPHWDNIKI
jgi:hypothetical protein